MQFTLQSYDNAHSYLPGYILRTYRTAKNQ